MNSNHFTTTNTYNYSTGGKVIVDPERVSRQIEALRIVLRRMRSSKSSSIEAIIKQKLKELQ